MTSSRPSSKAKAEIDVYFQDVDQTRNESDDDDDLFAHGKIDRFKGNNNNNTTTNCSSAPQPQMTGRPVTYIPEIRNAFKTDPHEAIKQNVPLHTSTKDLDKFFGEIDEIAENHQQQSRVADTLWKNDDYRFIKMVQGYTNDNTLENNEVSIPSGSGTMDAGASANLFQHGSVAETIRSRLHGQDLAAFTERRPGPEDVVYSTERDKMRRLQNIDRVMTAPQVNGEINMSTVLFAAILESLVMLVNHNRHKYAKRQRHHFYGDETVMFYFARVVSTNILYNKVANPRRYVHVVDEARRAASMKKAMTTLDNNCTWDPTTCTFVLATVEDFEREKKIKRAKLLEAYQIDD